MKFLAPAVTTILLLASGSAALACKCAVSSREAAARQSQFVFDGRVLRVRTDNEAHYAIIEMLRPIKGAIPGTLEVATPQSSASCGYDFRKGQLLTVGVNLREQQFWANSCVMQVLNPGNPESRKRDGK